MYIIYQFFVTRITPFETLNNQWSLVSQHTQLEDAQLQLQRFVDSGVPVNQLQQLTDQDSIPTSIPIE